MVPIDSEILISGFIYFLFLQVVCFAVSKRPVAVYEAADKDVRDLRYWCFRSKGKLRYVFDKNKLLLCLVLLSSLWFFSTFIITKANATKLQDMANLPSSAYDQSWRSGIGIVLFSIFPLWLTYGFWLLCNKSHKKFKIYFVLLNMSVFNLFSYSYLIIILLLYVMGGTYTLNH